MFRLKVQTSKQKIRSTAKLYQHRKIIAQRNLEKQKQLLGTILKIVSVKKYE